MTSVVLLEAGEAQLTVHPHHGGRIGSLDVGGTSLLRAAPGPSALLWGSYPMAPWAGRIRHGTFSIDGTTHRLPTDAPPHAIHGTVHECEWELVDASRDQCELRCRLDHDGRWPLGGVAHQHIVLRDDGVTCVLSVLATSHRMPAVVGWHPCFVPPLTASLAFERQYLRDDDGIATDRIVAPAPLPWDGRVCDDCFTTPLGPITLTYPRLSVTIDSDCGHWVVYDGAPDALCIEPQSGPPDAVNLGRAAVLEPGDLLQRWMTWRWADASPPTDR